MVRPPKSFEDRATAQMGIRFTAYERELIARLAVDLQARSGAEVVKRALLDFYEAHCSRLDERTREGRSSSAATLRSESSPAANHPTKSLREHAGGWSVSRAKSTNQGTGQSAEVGIDNSRQAPPAGLSAQAQRATNHGGRDYSRIKGALTSYDQTSESTTTVFQLLIPTGSGDLALHVSAGQRIYLVGDNGTGKSSLLRWLYKRSARTAASLSTQRTTWLEAGEVEDHRPSRGAQYFSQSMASALPALMHSENIRAHRISAAFEVGDHDQASLLASTRSPIASMNALLAELNLGLSVRRGENELLVTKEESRPYRLSELSSGEAAVLNLAAAVLTADSGKMFLIDEPEAYLNRRLVTQLLNSLCSLRNDCAFVIATHNEVLPAEDADSFTLKLSACSFATKEPKWDAEIVRVPDGCGKELRPQDIDRR